MQTPLQLLMQSYSSGYGEQVNRLFVNTTVADHQTLNSPLTQLHQFNSLTKFAKRSPTKLFMQDGEPCRMVASTNATAAADPELPVAMASRWKRLWQSCSRDLENCSCG